MDAVASAIADPVRRRILLLLLEGSLTAGTVAAAFDISRPAVSRHLRVLRAAGLVTADVRGRQRIYTLETAPLEALQDWLAGFASQWEARFDALETEVHRARRDRRARTDPDAIPKEASA